MGAAIAVLGATSPGTGGRRLAVLGDMLELGDAAPRFHRELAEPLTAAKVDRVFLVGEQMAALHKALPEECRGGLWPTVEAAIPDLLNFLEPGDVVTIKGSYGVRISRIVERLLAETAQFET
jgi:UDP-N-acetylmuramoyl-tripeptide--D-alanyl-D-alanine ligase